MDDEPLVLDLLSVQMAEMGHAVCCAGSVRQALAFTGPFDLMLLDLRLPDGTGRDVAAHFSGQPTLYVSAYEDADLRKPFSRGQLAAAVAERLRRDDDASTR